MQTQTLGPKTQQPPTPLYSSPLSLLSLRSSVCLFFSPSSSLMLAVLHMCGDTRVLTFVKITRNEQKYNGGEGEREREDRWFQEKKKKQSVGAEEEEGSERVLKRQARLPLHLHTA